MHKPPRRLSTTKRRRFNGGFDIAIRMRLTSKVKFGIMFVMHQVIVVWVVITSANILAGSILNFLHLFGLQHPRAVYLWFFSGKP
jgi:hypothetical protein